MATLDLSDEACLGFCGILSKPKEQVRIKKHIRKEQRHVAEDLNLRHFDVIECSPVVFVFVGQGACVDEWPRIFDLLLRMKSGEAA